MMEEEKSDRKKGRRVSTMGMKKAAASALGESKLGRTALVRFMGSEGETIVAALKDAATKVSDRATAKQLKKDLMKWVLKASVLRQHKALTKENTAYLLRPVQLSAELLVDLHETKPAGARDVTGVSQEFLGLGAQLRALLEPHVQDKNVCKVERIVQYYAAPAFLTRLMNDAALESECQTIVEATRTLLLGLPSVLHDEESLNAAQARARVLTSEAGEPTLAMCLGSEHPAFTSAFATYLDAQQDPAPAAGLRFALAAREFGLITAPKLRATRARTLFSKFLAASTGAAAEGASAAGHSTSVVLTRNQEALDALQASIDIGVVPRTAFDMLAEEVKVALQLPFQAFAGSPRAVALREAAQAELAELQARFGDRLAGAANLDLAPSPGAAGAACDFAASVSAAAPPPAPAPPPVYVSASATEDESGSEALTSPASGGAAMASDGESDDDDVL